MILIIFISLFLISSSFILHQPFLCRKFVVRKMKIDETADQADQMNPKTLQFLENEFSDTEEIVTQDELEFKTKALQLIDCLTSTNDPKHSDYDIEKDIRRDELLVNNDYGNLKVQLRMRGLDTSGDKTEMMIRLLLNVIDAKTQYSER